MKGLIFVCLSVGVLVDALYDSSSDVIELTPSNFDRNVINSPDVWIVEFYAPWCGHCKSFAPEYSKAATALKGIVKVGGVDANTHQSLGGQFGVRGFPTVKIFVRGKPIDYQGPRTAKGLIEAGLNELKKLALSRIGESSGGDYSGSSGSGSGSKKDVIELTDSNFKDTVMDSEDMWLVEFYAPWCGHCKNLEPHWAKAATELKGKVKLGALDATVHTIMSNKYGIRGFPTIKFFPAGKKTGEAEEYDGGRTSADIVSWALSKYSENLPPPEVKELTNEKVFKDVCENSQLCVISFLPDILDCQSKCRNDYISELKKVAERFKKNQWGYLWAEATKQNELEQALDIGGFGYPAMAALNVRKMKYSVLRGSFGYEGITEFSRDLSFGKGPGSVPIRGAQLPKINKVEPWDGKDGQPPTDEAHEEL